jgi:hypothetical protein
MMIINDDSRVVNQLEASLTDDDRVIIYDHHKFIVQATGQTGLTQVELEPLIGLYSLLDMKSLKKSILCNEFYRRFHL